jgi:hypothetical protein
MRTDRHLVKLLVVFAILGAHLKINQHTTKLPYIRVFIALPLKNPLSLFVCETDCTLLANAK